VERLKPNVDHHSAVHRVNVDDGRAPFLEPGGAVDQALSLDQAP